VIKKTMAEPAKQQKALADSVQAKTGTLEKVSERWKDDSED